MSIERFRLTAVEVPDDPYKAADAQLEAIRPSYEQLQRERDELLAWVRKAQAQLSGMVQRDGLSPEKLGYECEGYTHMMKGRELIHRLEANTAQMPEGCVVPWPLCPHVQHLGLDATKENEHQPEAIRPYTVLYERLVKALEDIINSNEQEAGWYIRRAYAGRKEAESQDSRPSYQWLVTALNDLQALVSCVSHRVSAALKEAEGGEQ